jgi:NADH-quinone oxidoreductase subunit L
VLGPLIALAVPSIFAGGILIWPMLFKTPHLLGDSIFVLMQHNVLALLGEEFHGAGLMALSAGRHLPLWLSLAGIATAWFFSIGYPAVAEALKKRWSLLYTIVVNKYGFDDFNQLVFVRGTRKLGYFFYDISDLILIDGIFVNGSGKVIRWLSRVARRLQSGYIYHYTFAMVTGLLIFLGWFLLGT